MDWLSDIENHRKRQVAMMAKAFDGSDIRKATGDNDVSERKTDKPKKGEPYSDKSDMYKMKILKLRKFNEQDQKEYVGVEDVANSYIANHENGDIVISKTTDGYLVSKFPIDTDNEEGEETDAANLSDAIDVALQYKEDLDNAKAPEQIMYKETEKSSTDDTDEDEYDEDTDDTEKGFDDEINPFERAAWESEQEEIAKAYATLGLDYDIEKAKHNDGDMHPNGKWVWRASANGGKGDWRVAKTGGSKATAGGAAASSPSSGSTGTPNASSSYFSKLSNSLIEKYSKKKESVSLSDIEEFYEDFLRDRGQEPTRKAYANEAKKTYDAIVANWNKKTTSKTTSSKNKPNSYYVKLSKEDLEDVKNELVGKSIKYESDPSFDESVGKKNANDGKTFKIKDIVEGNVRGRKTLMIKTDAGYFAVKNINADKFDHGSKITIVEAVRS